MSRNVKALRISCELLEQLLSTGVNRGSTSTGFPADGKILTCRMMPHNPRVIEYLIESAEFPEIDLLADLPEMNVQFMICDLNHEPAS